MKLRATGDPVQGKRPGPVGVSRPVAALGLARVGYGTVQLIDPGVLADRVLADPLGPGGRAVVRLLAARQMVQAIGCGPAPGDTLLALGAGVDLLHSISMLGLGIVDGRYRRAALADAVVAGGFALAGALAARAMSRRTR